MEKDNYKLTDKQYSDILQMIKKTVEAPNFKSNCYDSDMIGDKYTESNCGFCNDNYATEETASGRAFRSKYYLKDLRKYQKCPFDLRPQTIPVYKGWGKKRKYIKEEKTDYSFGCFYDCFLFGNGKEFKRLGKSQGDVEYIRYLVRETIIESEVK